MNVYYWNWPPQIAALFEAITPGLFGARNMFWVGVISYISDNSPTDLRTLKYGIINAIYTISTLIGTGLAGFINVGIGFYGAFMVPIMLNSTAVMISLIFIKDSSNLYDKKVVWLKPKYFLKSYMSVFKRETKYYTISIMAMLLCHSILVGRIGGKL